MAKLNGHQVYEAASKLRQLNIPEALNLLPKSEMQVLTTVNKLQKERAGKPVYASDVAQAIGVTAPAVSRSLKNLENKEYIRRINDRSDRRNVYIIITEAGQEAMEQNIKKMSDFIERVLSRLGDEEIETFTRIYHKIHDSIALELHNQKHQRGE